MRGFTSNIKCPILGINICAREKCLAWNKEIKKCIFIQAPPQALECLERVIKNEIGVYNLYRQHWESLEKIKAGLLK